MFMANEDLGALSRAPKYVQVKEAIRRKIISKEWVDGCRIPVEAEFCEMYGVSRITIRKALEDLQSEGYLVKIQGKGTFVQNQSHEQHLSKFYSFREELNKRGMEEAAVVLEVAVMDAPMDIAAKLEIEPGQSVFRIHRVRRTEHGPYAIETSYIPYYLCKHITKQKIHEDGLYRTLANYGLQVNAAKETFRAINVNKEQSNLLDVRIDAAAIALTRIAYSGSQVVEYCVCVVRGDFFRFSVELK